MQSWPGRVYRGNAMLGSIKYNLTHLFDFRGRDGRQTFWYYVLFLVIVEIVAGIAFMIPPMIDMFHNIFAAARAGVTDQQAMNDLMANQMAGIFRTMAPLTIGLNLVLIALFVAAFVRRLHDSGKPGWWALLPVATQLAAVWISYTTMNRMQDLVVSAMQNPQGGMQYHNPAGPLSLIGWIGYIAVLVFGIMKSTDGPNRYGEAPVEF
jgi:uncharacterized membrane protein YhaH (DUF805 family)